MPTFSDIFSVIADLDERTTQGQQGWRPGDSQHSFTTGFQGLDVTLRRDPDEEHITAVLKHPRGYFTELYTPQELGSDAAVTLRDLYQKVSEETAATRPHQAFIKALRNIDPMLASIFLNVEAQGPGTSNWQYMWVGYQQDHGALAGDREAAKILQAYRATLSDSPDTPGDLAKEVAAAIANPYHRMVEDFARSEHRQLDEDDLMDPGQDQQSAKRHRALDDLIGSFNEELAHAEALLTRGLRFHSQSVYTQGIAVLERVYDLT